MSINAQLISGWKTHLLQKKIQWFIIAEAFKLFRKPILAITEMIRMRDLYMKTQGITNVNKYIKYGDQSYWTSDYCGYPSENFKILIKSEFLRNTKVKFNRQPNLPKIQTLIWGITNRCPLSCRHCYEWDNIAQKDKLSLEELKQVLAIFKANGLKHIQFSGGEPLARFNDLVELTSEASSSMDCWVLTSGYGLTKEKAIALKEAGLTGVNISLDHWDEQLHNSFRNNEKSFSMVMDAINNCLSASIMVSLSLCATREFATEENLIKYATLAKNAGVHFIRILEPRAAGKFARQKVHLDQQQVALLSDFSIRLNTDPQYNEYPIITFFGYHQRLLGCFGAGNRYIYADPNGDVHACPFCRGIMGNLLEEPFNDILDKLKGTGCHEFMNESSFTMN